MKKRFWLILRVCLYVFIAIGGIFVSTMRFHSDLIFNNASTRDEETVLSGTKSDWELYYNKFLIIDEIDLNNTEYDAIIKTPHSWNKVKSKDGSYLPNYGYASYRTTLSLFEGLGSSIKFKKEATNAHLNVYLNRVKIASTGNVGKTFFENPFPLSYLTNETFKVDGLKEVEVIIEVGYNFVGGIDFTPKFVSTYYQNVEEEIAVHLAYVVLIFYLALFVVEAISYHKIYDSTIYTVNMTGAIFLTAFFSPLMNMILLRYGLFVPPFIFETLNFFFYCLFLFSTMMFFQYTYEKQLKTKGIVIGASFACAATFLYAVLMPFRLQFIAYIVYSVCYVAFLIKFSYFTKHSHEFDFTAFSTKCIFYAMIGMELTIICNTIDGFDTPISSEIVVYLILIFLIYVSIYVAFIVRIYRKAMDELKAEIQNKDLKLLVLKEQIKPHFIFNCLSSIKDLYHENEKTGDHAITLLADHLRYNVDAASSNLIEFSKEIDNVYNYVELKNLRTKNKFNVIYDIDYQDFKIPVLSIEPFVENAIKYSMVNEKEDGYIEIATSRDKQNTIVEIKDNGVGFNPENVRENAQGIKNVKERYAILLNANVEVNSEIGLGTNIKITIPDERENDESNCD